MTELFGIPTGTLAVVLAVALAASIGALVVLAVRNPVFVRLGLRNVPRRRGRTALIVTGLMLATTIIAAAMATGDTMSKTVRAYVVTSLGHTDELVSVRGTDVESIAVGESTQVAYFPEDVYYVLRDQVLAVPDVDGVAPAIVETVAVSDPVSRQNEPRVTLFATDAAAIEDFAPITSDGGRVSLADLRAGEIYVNGDAAERAGCGAGARRQRPDGPRPQTASRPRRRRVRRRRARQRRQCSPRFGPASGCSASRARSSTCSSPTTEARRPAPA